MATGLIEDDDATSPGRDLTSPAPAGMDPVETLRAVLGTVGDLAGTCWHEVGGFRVHEALGVLEQLDRRLGAVRAEVLATIEADGLWATGGQRGPTPGS